MIVAINEQLRPTSGEMTECDAVEEMERWKCDVPWEGLASNSPGKLADRHLRVDLN